MIVGSQATAAINPEIAFYNRTKTTSTPIELSHTASASTNHL